MNRQDFLQQLDERLGSMDGQERADVLRYFDELIQDKAADSERSQEEVILDLGPLDAVAKAVLEGSAQRPANTSGAGDSSPASGPVVKTVQVKALQVRNLVVRAYDMRVIIRPGNADEVVLTYPQDDDLRFDVSLQDGQLQLIQEKIVRFRLFGIGWVVNAPTLEVTVTLPKDFAASLDAQTSNGRIMMSGIDVWGSLRLNSSNGRIEVAQSRAKEMDVRTSNGRVVAQDVSAQGTLSLRTSNGGIEADRVRSDAALTLQSSNGSLRFSQLQANDLTLRTSNSTIEGSVSGSAEDYTVISATSNGKNGLKEHRANGPKRLDVHTSNGSIRVQFEHQ